MKPNTVDAKEEQGSPPPRKTAPTKESELVQRVIATTAFTRSAFLTRFLLYICECKLSGREDEISEYQIGLQAFDRPGSYNPGDDNIVRNYARILRKRLEDYFAGEGRSEPLRIVIPRGHYVPVFESNLPETEVSPSEPELQESPDLAPISQMSSQAPSWLRVHWLQLSVALLLALCIGTSIYWIARTRFPRVNDVFWREVFDRNRPTYLVPGDSGFAMLQDITGTEIHLNDYISGDLEEKFPDFNLAAARQGTRYGADRFSNYTSTADLSATLGIASRAQSYGDQLKICYARDLRMDELKRSNVILIGGPHANPWVELFEPVSNFRMFFPMHLDGMHIDERSFVNKHPRAGEQSIYANLAGDSSHRTYALISFLPGADGTGHVLLLEGQNMAGTQAAGDFLLDQHAMEPILKQAQLPDGSIGPFEILLEARTVGANAPEAHIAVERFGIGKASE